MISSLFQSMPSFDISHLCTCSKKFQTTSLLENYIPPRCFREYRWSHHHKSVCTIFSFKFAVIVVFCLMFPFSLASSRISVKIISVCYLFLCGCGFLYHMSKISHDFFISFVKVAQRALQMKLKIREMLEISLSPG